MKFIVCICVVALMVPVTVNGSGDESVPVSLPRAVGIVSTDPVMNALNISPGTSIEIEFTEPIDPATLDGSSFAVYSPISGHCSGTYSVVGATATFTPNEAFTPGEVISVSVTTAVASLAGPNLSAPYVFAFTVATSWSAADFMPGPEFPVGQQPGHVIATDLNSDGWPDIALELAGDLDSVLTYLNDGTGGFAIGPPITEGFAIGTPADLDADGDIDLVKRYEDDYHVISLLNDGSGNFTGSAVISLDYPIWTMCAGDFNGDGSLDIAAGSREGSPDHLMVLLNNGLGQLQDPTVTEVDEGLAIVFIQSADVDCDGDMDLIGLLQMEVNGRINVYRNDGTGNFSSYTFTDISQSALGWDVGDFNADCYMDMAIAGGLSGNGIVASMLNDGDNTFTEAMQYFSLEGFPWDLQAVDLTGDGYLDLATPIINDFFLTLKGVGDGQFQEMEYLPVEDYPKYLAMTDFDGDGDVDVALSVSISQNLVVMMNETCSDYDGDYFGDPNHPENTCAVDNCPSIYNPDQLDSDMPPDGIGDACSWSETVPSGTGMWVYFEGSGLSLDFPQVFSPGGEVSLEIIGSGPGIYPAGFQLTPNSMPIYYDISVFFAFTPPVTICIEYDDTGMTQQQEDAMIMWHWFANDWIPLTTVWHETSINTICATTNTFSIFALAIPLPYICGDADASEAVDIDDVVYLIAFIFSGGPAPIPYESGDADCSSAVDIDDVVWLISYIFSGGNAPCDVTGDEVPNC